MEVALHGREVLEAWGVKQGGPGAIAGIVRDANGAPSANATVALVPAAIYEKMEDAFTLGLRATVRTADDGTFTFSGVLPGSYLLTATASGWLPADHPSISLLPGESIVGIELRLSEGRDPCRDDL